MYSVPWYSIRLIGSLFYWLLLRYTPHKAAAHNEHAALRISLSGLETQRLAPGTRIQSSRLFQFTISTMVELIPPPEPHNLLPPLLACLPTAFASRRAPPALLSLLSPVLRQRLSLLSSTSAQNTDNWLRLLCWDNGKAEELKEIVENGTFEPHPSSGEIEVGEIETVMYKRFDQETLRAKIPLPEWSLTALYLWCSGGEDVQWKLAELLPFSEKDLQDSTWSTSITEANETSRARLRAETLVEAQEAERKLSVSGDDDDYWAMYDRTPANGSPAMKRSPAPNAHPAAFRERNGSADYYAQYGDVQPAMDNHDPDEQVQGEGESTLNGDSLEAVLGRSRGLSQVDPPAYQEPEPRRERYDEDHNVDQPKPMSPTSENGSDMVGRLEQTAERQAASEVGIRQHISTNVKSMFRLARSAGIDREEFERMMRTELDTLAMLDTEE